MASTTAAQNARVRIAGAGFTLFTFNGQPIAFCQQVAHTSPKPIAQFSAVQPMDEPYPIEILVPPAAGPGQLTLNMYELFGTGGNANKVWDRLGANVGAVNADGTAFGSTGPSNVSTNFSSLVGRVDAPFAGAKDIVDIFIRQAVISPENMSIVKYIRPLSAGQMSGGSFSQPYTEQYIGAQIVDAVDGETVAVGTIEIIKQITIAYRYTLRNGQYSDAFALRHGDLGSPAWLTEWQKPHSF